MDVEDRATLGEWVARGMGSQSIAKGLNEDGHSVGVNAALKHLRGDCPCEGETELKGLRRDIDAG